MKFVAMKNIQRDLSRVAGEHARNYINEQGRAVEALKLEQDMLRKQLVFLTKELADMRTKFSAFAQLS